MRLLPTRRLPGSGLLVTRVALGAEGEAPRAEVEAVLLNLGERRDAALECVGLQPPTHGVAASDTHGCRWTPCSTSAQH